MRYTTNQAKDILTLADTYAKNNSTCKKTAVGCYLVAELEWRIVLAKGCNRSKVSCKEEGCLREQCFGNNSKQYRSTCRCYKHHAEQDAISRIPKGIAKKELSAFVTRYPCEDCAKALVKAGVTLVVYGREFPISEVTRRIFEEANVEVVHISTWNCDENDKNN